MSFNDGENGEDGERRGEGGEGGEASTSRNNLKRSEGGPPRGRGMKREEEEETSVRLTSARLLGAELKSR